MNYASATAADTLVDSLVDLDIDLEPPCAVVVWDDPVNLMSYVTMVFRKVFGWPLDECHRKMMEVHAEGRSMVFAGPRDEAEAIATRLRSYQLWASIEK